MKLRIEDVFGEIISEDEITISQGDVLVCKFNEMKSQVEMITVLTQVKEALIKPETSIMVIPYYIDLSVIKREV